MQWICRIIICSYSEDLQQEFPYWPWKALLKNIHENYGQQKPDIQRKSWLFSSHLICFETPLHLYFVLHVLHSNNYTIILFSIYLGTGGGGWGGYQHFSIIQLKPFAGTKIEMHWALDCFLFSIYSMGGTCIDCVWKLRNSAWQQLSYANSHAFLTDRSCQQLKFFEWHDWFRKICDLRVLDKRNIFGVLIIFLFVFFK